MEEDNNTKYHLTFYDQDNMNETKKEDSFRTRKYQEENERVTTIIKVELINKIRYIAQKENISLRDVIETGLLTIVDNYESRHGEIRVRKTRQEKGDVSKVFDFRRELEERKKKRSSRNSNESLS